MIESYGFGRMKIDGVTYTSDLILYADQVRDNWRRVEGHKLHVEDLKEILEAKPEILVVGTGYYGLMKIEPESKKRLEDSGIRLMARKTGEAYKIYNELSKSNRVVGAFHLTC